LSTYRHKNSCFSLFCFKSFPLWLVAEFGLIPLVDDCQPASQPAINYGYITKLKKKKKKPEIWSHLGT
jgi:hypothetical protein